MKNSGQNKVTNDNDELYIRIKFGWFQKVVPEQFKTQNYYTILNYYLLEAATADQSFKHLELQNIGWPKNVFKKSTLYNLMFLDFIDRNSIFIKEKKDDFKRALNELGFNKSFHKIRVEGIVVQKKNGMNRINSILYHIRNSLAHGRFQIYSYGNDVFYCFESGIIKRKVDLFSLKSRMIIKEQTLLSWINILSNPTGN